MTTISPERLKELRRVTEILEKGKQTDMLVPVPDLISLLDLIERQREALEPFAKEGRYVPENVDDYAVAVNSEIKAIDLRRARAAYRGE